MNATATQNCNISENGETKVWNDLSAGKFKFL